MVDHDLRAQLQQDIDFLLTLKSELLLVHLRTPSGSSDERDVAGHIADCEGELVKLQDELDRAPEVVDVPREAVHVDDEVLRMMDEGCPWG